MRSSWGWLFVFSATRLIEGYPATSVGSSPPPLTVHSTCLDFVALMPPRSDPVVVAQILSSQYLAIEKNFIYHMELHSSLTRDHLYMVCLDETSATYMRSDFGIECVQFDVGKRHSRGGLWKIRVKIVRCLVLGGYNVIVSDADAVWLNDPIEDMHRLGVGESNIVGQRDKRPMDLSGYWGTTFCFGFLYFRAGGTTMTTLLDTTATIVSKNGDDQKAFNLALFSLGIEWDKDCDMAVQASTSVGRGMIPDGDEPFVVSLLPHSTYPRWCDHSPVSLNTTVVAHCLSKARKGDEMSGWMREVGAWYETIEDGV